MNTVNSFSKDVAYEIPAYEDTDGIRGIWEAYEVLFGSSVLEVRGTWDVVSTENEWWRVGLLIDGEGADDELIIFSPDDRRFKVPHRYIGDGDYCVDAFRIRKARKGE